MITRAMPQPDQPEPLVCVIVEHFVLAAVVLATVADRCATFDRRGATCARSMDRVPPMVTTSSVVWENISWQLAAIHAGDWLLKLLIIAVIVVLRHDHAAGRTATPLAAIPITRSAHPSKSFKYFDFLARHRCDLGFRRDCGSS